MTKSLCRFALYSTLIALCAFGAAPTARAATELAKVNNTVITLEDFNKKYGSDPRTPYALYGVQALQVILAAIEKSDGTRKGVRDQVFEGSGISIAADKAIIGKAIQIDPDVVGLHQARHRISHAQVKASRSRSERQPGPVQRTGRLKGSRQR